MCHGRRGACARSCRRFLRDEGARKLQTGGHSAQTCTWLIYGCRPRRCYSRTLAISLPSCCLATTATTTSTTSKTTRLPQEQKLQPPAPSPPLTFHTGRPDATITAEAAHRITTTFAAPPHAALTKPLTPVILQNTCCVSHLDANAKKNTSPVTPRARTHYTQARTPARHQEALVPYVAS